MALYTVQAPPLGERGAADPLALVFIKDGFCWPALFFSVPWLIFRRMWLVLLGWAAVIVALRALDLALPESTVATLAVLAGLLFAFEANGLRRWTLARNGWREIGVVEGRGRVNAESRFFSRGDPGLGSVARAPAGRPPGPASAEPEVIGLFPSPRGAR